MYQSINRHQFIDAFRIMDRMDNFSYDGLNALFDYLEELEDDIGQPVELDAIALCCDFSQDAYQVIAESYDIDDTEKCGDDELKERVIEFLEENTSVIYQDDESVLYQAF